MTSRLHYIQAGTASGQPILLLHGFMGSSSDWDACIAQLADEFRYIAVDLPGHGKSIDCHPDLYSFERCARALISILDELRVEQCSLVGYSLGGRMALYTASTYPERFGCVVLESASPGLRTDVEREERRRQDELRAQELEQGDFDTFLQRWYSQPLFRSLASDQPRLRRMIERRRHNDPHELAKSLRGMGTGVQPSLWERLPHLPCSLLLIVGEQDEKFSQIGRQMAGLHPAAQLVSVPHAGHNVHVENLDEYVRIVRTFFRHQAGV